MEWWVTAPDGQVPVGPVSTELMIQGILSGMVPKHALICAVGEARWKWIGEIPEFLAALEERRSIPDVAPDLKRLVPSVPALGGFEDGAEHTIVEAPMFTPSEPLPADVDDDEDERATLRPRPG